MLGDVRGGAILSPNRGRCHSLSRVARRNGNAGEHNGSKIRWRHDAHARRSPLFHSGFSFHVEDKRAYSTLATNQGSATHPARVAQIQSGAACRKNSSRAQSQAKRTAVEAK